MHARRPRRVWSEGGKLFRRVGMRIEEVIRCEVCRSLRPATVKECHCGTVVPFRAKKEGAR